MENATETISASQLERISATSGANISDLSKEELQLYAALDAFAGKAFDKAYQTITAVFLGAAEGNAIYLGKSPDDEITTEFEGRKITVHAVESRGDRHDV